MDNTKTEMFKKLIEMKKELNRKQRKLEKIKRAARAKAHIRKRISESVKDRDSTECATSLSKVRSPTNRSPPGNGRYPCNIISPSKNVRIPLSNILSLPKNRIQSIKTRSPINVNTLYRNNRPPVIVNLQSSIVKSPENDVRSPPSSMTSPPSNIMPSGNDKSQNACFDGFTVNHAAESAQVCEFKGSALVDSDTDNKNMGVSTMLKNPNDTGVHTTCHVKKRMEFLGGRPSMDIHDHNKDSTNNGRKKTDQKHKKELKLIKAAVASLDNSCIKRTNIETVLTKGHRNCNVDNMTENNVKLKCEVTSLVDDLFVDKSNIPLPEIYLHANDQPITSESESRKLSESVNKTLSECTSGTLSESVSEQIVESESTKSSKYINRKSSESHKDDRNDKISQDMNSSCRTKTKCKNRISKSRRDEQLKMLNQSSYMTIVSTAAENRSGSYNNQSVFKDGISEKKRKQMDICKEYDEVSKVFTNHISISNEMSNWNIGLSSVVHSDNLENRNQHSNSLVNRNMHYNSFENSFHSDDHMSKSLHSNSLEDSSINISGYPDRTSITHTSLLTESASTCMTTVTSQTVHSPEISSDSSSANISESSLVHINDKTTELNAGNKNFVHGHPVDKNNLNSFQCGRVTNMSSGKDHLESTLSLTPRIDQLQSGKVLPDKHECLYNHEIMTDSEFFHAIGLTQPGRMILLKEKIAENVNSHTFESEECEAVFGKTTNDHNQMSVKSLISQNLLNVSHVATSVVSTPLTECNIQQNTAGSEVQENSFTVEESESVSSSQALSAMSPNSFLEYTELDAIPYSQFELTEDFLSETQDSQESINQRRSSAKKFGALVKRRSSRISSHYFTHSKSASLMTNKLVSSSDFEVAGWDFVKHKLTSTKLVTEQKRAAAVLSVFQFLIDEAKKNSFIEFTLPSLYDSLKSNKLESASDLFETHRPIESKEQNLLRLGDSEVTNNQTIYHRFSLKKKVNDQTVPGIKRETEAEQNLANLNARNGTEIIQRTVTIDPCTDSVFENELHCNSIQEQETNSKHLTDESMSHRNTENTSLNSHARNYCVTETFKQAEDSNTDSIYQQPVGMFKDSTIIVKRSKVPINSSTGKFFSQSFGKKVAKKLFATKNNVCEESCDSNEHRMTAVLDTESISTVAVPAESTSRQHAFSRKLQENTSRTHMCSLSRDVKFTTSAIPFTVSCQFTKVAKYGTSPFDTNQQMTMPEQQFQSLDSIPVSGASTAFPGTNCKHAANSGLEVASLQFATSSTCSRSAPAFEIAGPPMSQRSPSLSLTSTPKTAPHRTGSSRSRPEFDVSFEENKKSNKTERSSMGELREGPKFGKLKTPVREPWSFLDQSESELSSQKDRVSFSDKSCASNAHNFVVRLHEEGVYETPINVTSAAKKLSETQNVSHVFVTNSNHIRPWKKLLKTASSPVLVLEQNTPRSYQAIPVFSPFIKRSRSKLLNNRFGRQNVFKFCGCFQSCTQDAVVALLNGTVKAKDGQMKNYIVSVQATSLTVWTEDGQHEWVAELDWKLSSEIHITKACLLPRSDSIIAIVASGWNKNDLFATLFVYDWHTEDTTRFNIPLLEHSSALQSAVRMELYAATSSELHVAMVSDTHYIIGRVVFDDSLKLLQSLTTSQVQRGKLLSFIIIQGQTSAGVSLTSDQEIIVWNMMLIVALKKIKVPPSLPCLTRLLAAVSHKGFLLLDTIWRVEDGDCGGILAVNPLRGCAQKIVSFSIPNYSWRRIEKAHSEACFMLAVSDGSSLSVWNRRNGALICYTKSKTTSCASIVTSTKHLVVGDIRGCVHIYSAVY